MCVAVSHIFLNAHIIAEADRALLHSHAFPLWLFILLGPAAYCFRNTRKKTEGYIPQVRNTRLTRSPAIANRSHARRRCRLWVKLL